MLRILVVTEDGSRQAHGTLIALAEKMLRLVDERYRIDQVAFEPPTHAEAIIARGNRWRSKDPHDHHKVTALVRTLATKLAEDAGFVMFHMDGDCPWSRRQDGQNHRQWNERIVAKVRALLAGQANRHGWTPDEIDRRITRLVPLMPFYSIEAWVYQNTQHAIRLCREHYRGRDIERFEEWQTCRERIDEVMKPKSAVCLGSKHNRELAEKSFPYKAAYQAGTSFAAAVDTLGACSDLRAALARTR